VNEQRCRCPKSCGCGHDGGQIWVNKDVVPPPIEEPSAPPKKLELARPEYFSSGVIAAVTKKITDLAAANGASEEDLKIYVHDIWPERQRQHEKWGEQNHADGTGAKGDNEIAAVTKKITDLAAANGALTWRMILEEEVSEAFAETDEAKLRAELVQVAAVAQAWVAALDRRTQARLDALH